MTSKHTAIFMASSFACSIISASAYAKDSSLSLSTGFGYSEGEYGDIKDTKVLSVPVSLTYRKGPWKMRVSVPWVSINGPASLIATPEGRGATGGSSGSSGSSGSNSGSGSSGGSGSGSAQVEDSSNVINSAQPALTNDKRSGLGDANVAMTYSLDLGGDFYLEPSVKVKLPTASHKKRLGTGKVDVTVSADMVKDIGDFSLYAHGRHKFAGKPSVSTIRSTWGAGAGVSLTAAEGLYVGADYDWQQSAFRGTKGSSEITGWTNVRLAKKLSLTLYGITGLNSQSADIAGGASISYRF